MKKNLFWIRTGLLLIILIFAVLGGNFLYTGAESASPLDLTEDPIPLSEDFVLIQTFSPAHSRVTAISVVLQAPDPQTPDSLTSGVPARMTAASGDLTITLSDHASGTQLYSSTVSLAGVPDGWYLDFPMNCRLDADAQYDLRVYAENYQEGMNPSLYLVPQSAQLPEIKGSLTAVNSTDNVGAQTGDSTDNSGAQQDNSTNNAGSRTDDSSDNSGSRTDASTDNSGARTDDSTDNAGSRTDNSADNAGTPSDFSTGAAAIRLTYDVLVPARLAVFLAALAIILLCAAATIFFSRKNTEENNSVKDLTLRKFLAVRIGKIPLIHILFFAAVTITAVIIRIAFLPVRSNDYYLCFESWINDMRSSGIWIALGQNIGDYPPLYITLLTLLSSLPFEPVVIIKLMPCLFDIILALVCVKLSGQLEITSLHKKMLLYAIILLNPLTLLNSAAWGQCDSLYGSMILLTMLAICGAKLWSTEVPAKNRHLFWKSGDGICLLFALALSFKLQAIFFLPILCLLWIMQKRNVLKPVQLLWVPIIYTISCIPMYLAGRSLKVMYKIYLGQANRNYGTLTLNYPNLYSLIGTWSEELYDSYFIYGMLLTFLLLLVLFYQLYCRKVKLDSLTLCKVTALSILTICFCLPLVHERYAYVAEMLLFVIMAKDAKHMKTALITMLCTLFTYCTYLMQLEQSFSVLPDPVIALIRLGVIFYLTGDIFRKKRQVFPPAT